MKCKQVECHERIIQISQMGISCFLLVAGVSIFVGNKLGVRGLAEILVSSSAALAHPPGGGELLETLQRFKALDAEQLGTGHW